MISPGERQRYIFRKNKNDLKGIANLDRIISIQKIKNLKRGFIIYGVLRKLS